MSTADFLDHLNPKYANCSTAYYLQSQNDNMHSEYSALLEDVPEEIDFASIALGRKPDAVNFWLGNSKSITSFHRDHYENVYHVVAGTKQFLLYVPVVYVAYTFLFNFENILHNY